MMDNFFSGDRNRRWIKIIDGILVNDEDMFYNALYMAMTSHPSYVITSDLEDDRKKTILNTMLTYFEGKEEFEKCVTIYNIKKQLKKTC
tara:strand:+ start:9009 stop:9275 length:267 start_codon:yes stop_codon:yes gene_type:complete